MIHILNLMPRLSVYQLTRVRRRTGRVVVSAVLGLALAAPVIAAQQTPAPLVRAPAPVQWSDARWLGLFAGAAAAVMPLDRDGQRLMQRTWVQESRLLSRGADVFNAYGSPGVFVGSAALYVAGWATGRTDLARLGMRAGEAIVLSGIVGGGIKGVVGRARPYQSPGKPGDFRLFSGVSDGARQSFPSGHVTAAFAFAGAVDRELRASHPAQARWAGPLLYTAAALTGYARMHADKHWASDVVMGAGLGLVSARVVTRFHANRPTHWLDRHLLPHGGR